MAAFHPFPRLPAELRLQIWHLAAQPRLLVIEKASADATDFTSPTRPPPLTQACREARTSGPYEKAFFSSDSPPRYAWANFDLDTIHVDCAHICRDDLCGVFPERVSIQCLQAEATGDDFGWISDNCLLFSPQGFGAFPQLRRFDLVVDFDLALWAGFIGDTYFGPRCPRANVRVICAPTGEWIGESTSRWYGDWYSLHVADFEPARRLEPGEDDYYRSEVCPSQFIVPWAYSPLAGGEATEQTEDAASLMALAEASWLEEAMHAVEIDGSMA